MFIDAVGEHLPEEVVERLIQSLESQPHTPFRAGDFQYDQNVELRKRLYVTLGNTARYEQLCASDDYLHVSDYETLIRMYLDHEDTNAAQRWLDAYERTEHGYAAQMGECLSKNNCGAHFNYTGWNNVAGEFIRERCY